MGSSHYYVHRLLRPRGGARNDVRLDAKLENTRSNKDRMALLSARPGELLGHQVTQGYAGCETLVQDLVMLMLMDSRIVNRGGYLPYIRVVEGAQNVFTVNPFLRTQAEDKCDTIVKVDLARDRVTPQVGKRYLIGALGADYDMVFFYKEHIPNGPPSKIDVGKLRLILQAYGNTHQEAQAFVDRYGSQWYFCSCKGRHPNNSQIYRDCLEMDTID